MNIEDYLFHSLTKEDHQSYVNARQAQNMSFVANYDQWIAKCAELERLKAEDDRHTWDSSEHNPANYPDYYKQDDITKERWELRGEEDYNAAQKALDLQILSLEALLHHPDEYQLIDVDDVFESDDE